MRTLNRTVSPEVVCTVRVVCVCVCVCVCLLLVSTTYGIGMSLYMVDNCTSADRGKIAQLRSGVHCLRVETGRYDRDSREDKSKRICKLCLEGVEDELHFLHDCLVYSRKREELFDRLYKISDGLVDIKHVIYKNGWTDEVQRWFLRTILGDEYAKHKFASNMRAEVCHFVSWAMKKRRRLMREFGFEYNY